MGTPWIENLDLIHHSGILQRCSANQELKSPRTELLLHRLEHSGERCIEAWVYATGEFILQGTGRVLHLIETRGRAAFCVRISCKVDVRRGFGRSEKVDLQCATRQTGSGFRGIETLRLAALAGTGNGSVVNAERLGFLTEVELRGLSVVVGDVVERFEVELRERRRHRCPSGFLVLLVGFE